MTLRELVFLVDADDYADVPLYQRLRSVKPEYGSSVRVGVRPNGGSVVVTNVHVGSLGDIVTYPIDVAEGLEITNTQLLNAILDEMSTNGFSDADQSAFWSEMTNLHKAKIVR